VTWHKKKINDRTVENNSYQFSYNYDEAKINCFAKFVLRNNETSIKMGSKGAPIRRKNVIFIGIH